MPIMLEEFENGGFALKTKQLFSFHTTLREFKNVTITSHSGCVLKEDYRDYIILKKGWQM